MKVRYYSLIAAALLTTFLITGCSVKSKETAQCGMEGSMSAAADNCDMTNAPKIFTLDELEKYNGENGKAAYIAIYSVVYDVTNYSKWQDEKLFAGNKSKLSSGKDLSQYVTNIEARNEFINSVPKVGALNRR